MEANDRSRLSAVAAAASRLKLDYATSAAVNALEARGIPSILLKGASIVRWLYEPEDARGYVDCDLLVPPRELRSAVHVLEALGFEPAINEAHMPSWWREHAVTMVSRQDGTVIDLHRNLPGVQVRDEQLWATLSEATTTMTIGGYATRVLTEPARGLHAALHVAQHGGSARGLDVLQRALQRMSHGEWRTAAELSSRLQADAAFQRGLSFLPAGAQLARRLDLRAAPLTEVELRAARAPEALTLARLLATPGVTQRLSIVRYKLVPPPTFMRAWSPLARRGRLGLVGAYLWRPAWIVTRFPAALRAWLRARH